MHDEIVRILYQLVNKQSISDADKNLLEQWVSQSEHNRQLYEEVLDAESLRQEIKASLDYDSKPLWKKISKKLFPKKNNLVSVFRNPLLRYAAVAILILGFGGYFLFFNKSQKKITSTAKTETKVKNDIAPGTDKAMLTLANGSTIVLDNSRSGVIIQHEGTTVTNQGAQLEYNADGTRADINHAVTYHTLSTPRGGQYQLLLPDGSKAFLNAASSIRFPTAFTGKERTVEITGEAYFEVAKDVSKPFKVKVNTNEGNQAEIQVLGTSFNINAYNDEPTINTTLLEGVVKISAGGKNNFLRPGQQAQLNENGEIKTIDGTDVNAAVAWKNGLLVFSQADIRAILRQISRWYNIDFEYKADLKVPKFYGEIPRHVTLSEVLKIIEINSKLQFIIEGNKVIVKQP